MIEIVTTLPPSCNHCYKNAPVPVKSKKTGSVVMVAKRVLTDEAEAWMRQAGLTAKVALRNAGWIMPKAGAKVVVELRVAWPDNRRRDMNNLHKLTADALEGIAYVNDQYALLRDMDYRVSPKTPGLFLTVYLLSDEQCGRAASPARNVLVSDTKEVQP